MDFSAFSEFWFDWVSTDFCSVNRWIAGKFINLRLATSNNAFAECRVLSYVDNQLLLDVVLTKDSGHQVVWYESGI